MGKIKINENQLRNMIVESVYKHLMEDSEQYDTTLGGGKLGETDNFYGCKSIKIRWHGEFSDPELIYNGMTINYYDVENMLVDEARDMGIDENDDMAFENFVQEHESEIQDYIMEYGEKEYNPFEDDNMTESKKSGGIKLNKKKMMNIVAESVRKVLNES